MLGFVCAKTRIEDNVNSLEVLMSSGIEPISLGSKVSLRFYAIFKHLRLPGENLLRLAVEAFLHIYFLGSINQLTI